jgi:hypothetical protein
MPQLQSAWPLLDPEARAARRRVLDLAVAAAGGGSEGYEAVLARLAEEASASPEGARRLLEAAGTLLALAVGTIALEDIADFVREFDEVDLVIEADDFLRSVEETLANPSLTDRPGDPQGGFPG